uniref:Uncharacterized protein n=1 Tax=Arion vulgaris TaxID=1028688 RepID=A0A0B7A5F2_9EUPU
MHTLHFLLKETGSVLYIDPECAHNIKMDTMCYCCSCPTEWTHSKMCAIAAGVSLSRSFFFGYFDHSYCDV